MKTTTIILLLFLFLVDTASCFGGTKDFRQVSEQDCSPLAREDMLKLPLEYHKYLGFVKMCRLKRMNSDRDWRTALISIWAHDYLRPKGDAATWEDFPPALLVDRNFKAVGKLSELYPMDWATHLVVSYGKWHNGRPTEIRVDVSNPAVSGDYYYAPLLWKQTEGRYEMKSQQPTTGKRPDERKHAPTHDAGSSAD